MTIAEKLVELETAKRNIKAAVLEKNTASTISDIFSGYPQEILNIKSISSPTLDCTVTPLSGTTLLDKLAHIQSIKIAMGNAIQECGVSGYNLNFIS